MSRRWLPSLGLSVAVCVIYFLAARLGLFLLTRSDGVAVFWPASGVSSGILIARGRSARWPVAAGVMAAIIIAHLTTDGVTWLAATYALCNSGEALLVAWLIGRFVGGEFTLNTLGQVLALLAVAVIGAAAAAAVNTLGVKLFYSASAPTRFTLLHLFSSNASGIITTAPLIIGIASLLRTPPPRREIIEGAAALIALAAMMAGLIFLLPRAWWDRIAPVELLLPLLLWVSARCRPAFTCVAVFIVSLAMASAFIFGIGHFGAFGPTSMYATRSAVLGVAIFSYILAALFAERRQAEENQKTLTSELQHRTNNLLTVVQIIANRTLSDEHPRQEKDILEARLRALARANKQLTDSDWSGLTLSEIIRAELEPYLARCEIEGSDVVLDRQQAQNFSLVLHELATNALKYGALSNQDGRIHIAWGLKGDGRDGRLSFHWREQGGPPVVAPTRQGFGSKLLHATFANARSRFDNNGFSCEIEVPLGEVVSPAG